MPSMDRPSWRGVSTPREESTINYIAEGLTLLERSTTLLRHNLSNYLSDNIPERIYPETDNTTPIIHTTTTMVTIEEINEETRSGLRTMALPEVGALTQEVDAILEENANLRVRVDEVLEANEAFKEDMKQYLEDSAKWKQEFVDETRQIELDLQAVLVHRSNQIDQQTLDPNLNESVPSLNIGISCGLKDKLMSWYTVAGMFGKNTIRGLKQKWNSLQIGDAVLARNIESIAYNTNSYFDISSSYF